MKHFVFFRVFYDLMIFKKKGEIFAEVSIEPFPQVVGVWLEKVSFN